MAEIQLRIDNGLNSSGDPLRLKEGFLKRCEGAIYMPDDPDRLYKIPGRTEAAALPAAATAGNTVGLAHLQYNGANDQFVLFANSQLYEVDAATSGIVAGSWSDVADQQPTAFVRSGSFLKAIPDGDNGWIMWTGAANERPIIREEGGHSWYLGLNKPVSGAVSAITTTPTKVLPTSNDNVLTSMTLNGSSITPTLTWDAGASAYDSDEATKMFLQTNWLVPPKYAAKEFSFTEGGNIPSDENLTCILGGIAKGIGKSRIHIQISYDGGTTYNTLYTLALDPKNSEFSSGTQADPYKETIQIPLTAGTLWTQFKVRAVNQISGFGAYTAMVFEIFAQESTAGNAAAVDDGTYYYCHTEVFETGGDRPRYIESAPSPPVSITLAGTENGVLYTFDTDQATSNGDTDGIVDDPNNELKHYRKIYRTTKSGTWPDLGYIGTATIDATTFADTFTVSGETLGSPGINIVYVQDVPVEAAGVPPAFLDAVLFNGSVVAIPVDDPFKIVWFMPGQPNYHPYPAHEIAIIASTRSDELKGLSVVGDSLLIYSRTQVRRIRALPVVDQANYIADSLEIELLSPNEGLTGSPLGHTIFESQKGHAVAIWVSDNGLWMTDGSLVAEGGMGVVKLSVFMDWRKEVDVSQLSSSKLFFDSVLQIICFDYVDTDGNNQLKFFHSSPHHWVNTGQDQAVPKTTGPHPQFAVTQRVIGEFSGVLKHLSLDKTNRKVYNERDGNSLAGTDIVTHVESGKNYVANPQNEFQVYDGSVYHSDWGPSESGDLSFLTEYDHSGITQSHHTKGLRLNGERTSEFFVNLSGQSVKMVFRHVGITTSDGSKLKSIGPVVLEIDSLGDVEGV